MSAAKERLGGTAIPAEPTIIANLARTTMNGAEVTTLPFRVPVERVHTRRAIVEAEIERLIALLDEIDGDADEEPYLAGWAGSTDDCEDGQEEREEDFRRFPKRTDERASWWVEGRA